MAAVFKKPLCALLALCLLWSCAAEDAPEPEYMDIVRLISRCTLLTSFELHPEDAEKPDDEICRLIFADGEFAPAEGDVPPPEDCEVQTEEAQKLDDGRIKVNVSVYRDFGEGPDFDCAFYAYFVLTDGGYRLCGVFFPD